MGVSEKQSENAIGQFGEGLKLSMLVLTRMGKIAQIESGDLFVTNDSTFIDGVEVLKRIKRGHSLQSSTFAGHLA